MSIAVSDSYSPRLYRRARLGILILAVLGLMTFVAVRDMAGQCRTEQDCIATADGQCITTDSGQIITTGRKNTRCELTAGWWLRVALPEHAAHVLWKFGIPVSYI